MLNIHVENVVISYQKSDLTSHQKSVHLGGKYQCGECDNHFSHKLSLITHQQLVHTGKKYT